MGGGQEPARRTHTGPAAGGAGGGQGGYYHFIALGTIRKGFPGGSVGKEPACNAGNPGSIPGSERSPGEGIGYPL